MKKFLTPVIFAILSVGAMAQTQTASTVSDSGAINSGIDLINNSYAPTVTSGLLTSDAHIHTNQAAAVPPSFSSQASVQTCAAAGKGLAVQVLGGGFSAAGGSGVDAGCDLERDLKLMAYLKAEPDMMQVRACMKPEIQVAMKMVCDRVSPPPAGQQPQPVASAVVVTPASAPKPWQAGG